MRTLALILVVSALLGVGLAQSETRWPSMREIRRLSIAVALADYPLPESKVKETIGLPTYLPPVIGGGGSPNRAAFLISALSDPEDPKGYFAIRYRYLTSPKSPTGPPKYLLRKPEEETEQKEPERIVSEIDILFFTSSPGLQFKADWSDSLLLNTGVMKERMEEMKMSPREFSEALIRSVPEESQNPPNQPPLQTPTSGTPAAGAPDAPPPGAAGR
jgi:hypothetical protein